METLQAPVTTRQVCAVVDEVRRSFPDLIAPRVENETIGRQTIHLLHTLCDELQRVANDMPGETQDAFVWFAPTLDELKQTISLSYHWPLPSKDYALHRLKDTTTVLNRCLDRPDIPQEFRTLIAGKIEIIHALCTYFYSIFFISHGHAPEYLP